MSERRVGRSGRTRKLAEISRRPSASSPRLAGAQDAGQAVHAGDSGAGDLPPRARRIAAGLLEEVGICDNVCNAEFRESALPRPEEIPRTAEPEVDFAISNPSVVLTIVASRSSATRC